MPESLMVVALMLAADRVPVSVSAPYSANAVPEVESVRGMPDASEMVFAEVKVWTALSRATFAAVPPPLMVNVPSELVVKVIPVPPMRVRVEPGVAVQVGWPLTERV